VTAGPSTRCAVAEDHGNPLDEPMLWIADQVVGAAGDAHTGDDRWFRALADSVELVRIEL